MSRDPANPLIVQGDRTILVEVDNPRYADARDALARFAELEKSPEHVHTYRITPLSLWNAAAAGLSAAEAVDVLERFGKYPLPDNVRADMLDYVSRYGRVKLVRDDSRLMLVSDDRALLAEILHHPRFASLVIGHCPDGALVIDPAQRGHIKHALVQFGYPAEDLAGYVDGARLEVALRATRAQDGVPFALRGYQQEAAAVFHASGSARGGSGVIVLPCGAGKTLVGLAVMAGLQCHTLILTPSIVAARQWIREILDKTSVPPEVVGEYSGERKDIRPITVTTYQVLTYRPTRSDAFPHFALFEQRDWGLIIYDEVHLLPAPVFRITAEIQARRRLGLTATLVREDGREDDVFALVGPKRFDVPWRELEAQGWIAEALCAEVRVPLDEGVRMAYAVAPPPDKFRIASVNPIKDQVVVDLAALHRDDTVLVIGQYIEQLEHLAKLLGCPIITGKTANREREKLYAKFRSGEEKLLVVSKVANFSIDLPEANVAIQVSATFGSRQE